MITGSRQKSEAEVTRLVREVIHSDDFDHHDFDGFNAHTQMKHFDRSEMVTDDHDTSLQHDGWMKSSTNILVPTREWNPDGNG